MRYALVTGISRKSRGWRVDNHTVAGSAGCVPFDLPEVRSWNPVKRISGLGPGFTRPVLEARRHRHSGNDLRSWLQLGLLVL